jgi:hypothetical protein
VQGSITGPNDSIRPRPLIHYDSSPELRAPQDSRARLAGKARHSESGLARRACRARPARRALESTGGLFQHPPRP